MATPFSRVRVEIDIGNGRFVPLIDGPLASVDAALDSQPGRSTATMVVRDDSAFLQSRRGGRAAVREPHATARSSRSCFGRFEQISDTRIDATDATHRDTQRRGTVLRFPAPIGLGERTPRLCAAWRPTAARASAASCPTPPTPPSLPPLVMIGDDRNLANASITEDPEGPERTHAQRAARRATRASPPSRPAPPISG